jgi:hypothetical protein
VVSRYTIAFTKLGSTFALLASSSIIERYFLTSLNDFIANQGASVKLSKSGLSLKSA